MPISDKLIELGFLDLVESRKNKNKELLFDERGYYTRVIEPIKPSKLSDWFRTFKRKLLPSDEWYCKRFHSLRHNFVNTGKQSMIPERIREEITGHEGKNKSMQETYSTDYNLPILKDAIDKWHWECNFKLLKMKK